MTRGSQDADDLVEQDLDGTAPLHHTDMTSMGLMRPGENFIGDELNLELSQKEPGVNLTGLSRRDSDKLKKLIDQGINITDQSPDGTTNLYQDSDVDHSRVEAKSRQSGSFMQAGTKIFKNISRIFGSKNKKVESSYGMAPSEATGNPSASEQQGFEDKDQNDHYFHKGSFGFVNFLVMNNNNEKTKSNQVTPAPVSPVN